MKKALCLLLAFVFLVPVPAFAQAQSDVDIELSEEADPTPTEELQLLWDIPFGIGIDEFIALAEERTGFTFISEPNESDGIRRDARLQIEKKGSARVVGYSVYDIIASFDKPETSETPEGETENHYSDSQDDVLKEIIIQWDVAEDAPPEYSVNCFAGILYELEQKYGEAIRLSLSVYDQDWNEFPCRIEKSGAYIDTSVLLSALNQGDSISVVATFNNIGLFCIFGSEWEAILLSFEDTPRSLRDLDPEPLPTYEELLATRSYGVGF